MPGVYGAARVDGWPTVTACSRCQVRPARRGYHLWQPELCAVCVEDAKHPNMRRSARVLPERCEKCGGRAPSGDVWRPAWCTDCIEELRDGANRLVRAS